VSSYLLDDTTADSYSRWVSAGAERVAARIAGAERPFTGIAPDRLEPLVRGIDLDRPLHDPAAALDELDRV
jgi:L-2,4-diaminobutyrate decarboxylase